MLVLVESLEDEASRTITAALRETVEWDPDGHVLDGHVVETADALPGTALVPIDGLHIHAERLDERLAAIGLEADEIVFLSRHASQTGRPTLTVHPVGNFGQAKLGGEAGRFTPVRAGRMSQMLRALAAERDASGYESEVSFEVTHHGPLVGCPAFFVELGSTAREWGDRTGGQVVARAVVATVADEPPGHPVLLGVGGGHYAPRFTDGALRRAVNYGHLWPTHALKEAQDIGRILTSLAEATPGVKGAHLHEVPRSARKALRHALAEVGIEEMSAKEAEAASAPS